MTPFRSLPCLLLALASLAAPLSADPAPDEIEVTVSPVFPANLEMVGYREGDADVAIMVDSTGKLVDSLITASTREAFADEAIRVVRRWKYHAGKAEDGQPVGWVRHITMHFETTGVQIVQNSLEHPSGWLKWMDAPDSAIQYRAYSPKELDGIPRFTHFVAPMGPHAGTVTVEFYVDETGAVRLPAVRDDTDADLTSAALTAVSQWHFEPPLHKRRAVLLKVTQDLRFVDKKG